ncbi:hypothetical protein N7517_007063 [Penicillium concentricum]|uniref:Uncharacterized protein n=1 Tax=Penicillium concentricum TaxID=293559 RepID=A0A9W9VAQ5_9EURO|nr:uncharacterized protein N7517_007063 [Penicillium concentricum]KAJ5375057.1 hypothetical protein N7517_007063 [Penicillium concentricum]
MESTTEPTGPIMDPNHGPLRNLDLWCDWTGIPEDPVSITIAMELHARGHPNLNLPVLNVQSPNIVKRPSWFIRLKPELAHYDIPPEQEFWPSQEYGDAERYPAKNPSISPSGSVVVHDGSRDNDPVSRRVVDISAQFDSSDSSTSSNSRKSQSQVDSLGSLNSPNPRKRSAKAASLPDSIPPDDDYQGTRHKLTVTKIDLPGLEPVSQDTSTTTNIISSSPCPIRRLSASLEETSVTNENIPPQASAPNLVPDSQVTSEHLSLNSKKVTVDVENEIPLCYNRETRSEIDLANTEPLTEANLRVRNYDTLSTRVCNGSLSETEDSNKEKEDLLLSLESIGSPSFFSGHHELPLPRTSAEIANKPELVLDNDILYLQTPPSIYSATYQIAIYLKVRLQKGKSRDWWELVVSGLPRLVQFESYYLYFRTPPGQGMEFMTSSFKRHTLVESCLMAQFDGGKSLVVPFRKCNAQFYGPLKDHKVNTVIQSEVEEVDPSSYMIKYNAVCSIDLVNHNFWAEKCQFDLVVHGGPEGEFEANFEAQKPLINTIRLQPALAPDLDGIGLSRINITSIPQALDMFTVSWEVKLPRGKAYTWLPWIKTRYSDVETILLEDYALSGPAHEYLSPIHQGVGTRCQDPWCQLGVGLNHFEPPVEKTPHLYDGFGIHDTGVFNPFSEDSASYLQRKALLKTAPPLTAPLFKSASTQTFVGEIPAPKSTKTETPVAESKPKKPHRVVRGLWTLIKFFFHLFAFLASVHTLYWSYLLHNCGFRFDPYDFPTSCPQKEVYVYLGYAENVTNADVGKEANTVLEEFVLQPELIRSEVQSINTTPAEITPVPLRDRIDYLLGWRGPIARE